MGTNKVKQFDCSGKTAIITGALGLLGPEWAIALAEIGANVILTDVNKNYNRVTETIEYIKTSSENAKISYYNMDVLNKKNIEEVAKQYNPDIIVNNAALDPKVTSSGVGNSSRFEDMSLDFWHQGLEVIMDGTFMCCQVFGQNLISQNKPGVFINIASELSVIAPDQRLYEKENVDLYQQSVKPITYMVAKHGVVAITKYLATYPSFLKNNIRVNALSPSGVFNNHPQDFVDKLSSRIPLNRMARKHEYRGAIQFLASDASSYMNGHNLVIDGAKSCW